MCARARRGTFGRGTRGLDVGRRAAQGARDVRRGHIHVARHTPQGRAWGVGWYRETHAPGVRAREGRRRPQG